MQRLSNQGDYQALLEMPPVSYADEIIGYLSEIGFSDKAVKWSEIKAWSDLTGVELTPWQSKTIKQLSVDYVIQLSKSAEASCPAPFTTEPVKLDRERIADKVSKALDAFSK